jgi:hypothetical protein
MSMVISASSQSHHILDNRIVKCKVGLLYRSNDPRQMTLVTELDVDLGGEAEIYSFRWTPNHKNDGLNA